MARPRSENPTAQVGVSLVRSDWEYVRLWHPGNESDGIREVLVRVKKMWPAGPFDNSVARSCSPRSGGRRELKRNIRDLEAQLEAAGLVPITKRDSPAPALGASRNGGV